MTGSRFVEPLNVENFADVAQSVPRKSRRTLVVFLLGSVELAGSQWTVSWLWHISTNFAMRAARVSGFFAS
jgi:hypothetical protein